MHEYSVVQSLMQRVEAEALAHKARAVDRITVGLGELSGVDPELLLSAFELFRQMVPLCRNAQLQIREIPAAWRCRVCDTEISKGEVLRCKICQKPAQLACGDEILLDRIELEVP